MSEILEEAHSVGVTSPVTAPPVVRQPPPTRLLQIVPLVVLGALPLVLLRFGTAPLSDPDTLWHVLAGRQLWRSWHFAGPDSLGTFTQLPFVYHQWLPELAMADMDALGGLPAVAWLFHVMLTGFLVAVYVLCRSQAQLLAALLATVVTWLGAGGSLSPRPQIMGFAFLAVSLWTWLRTERSGRVAWWLIPLTWLWACVHGTWVYAVGLSFLFSVGLTLDGRLRAGQALRTGGLLALSMVAVAALTPVGPRLLLTPAAISAVSPFIQEWRPTPISDPSAVAVLGMGLVVLLVWLRRREPVPWTRLLLWVAAIASTLMYARTIAVGAILMAPMFAEALQRGLPSRATSERLERRILVGSVLVSVLLAAALVPATAASPGKVPRAFDATLASLPSGTVIWNVDALGGWLMYAHPNLRPTMDTRAEVYGADYVRAYVRAISASPGWLDTVVGSGARYALLEDGNPLAKALAQQEGWMIISQDATYVLLGASQG